ncbi:unnamed protein product [Protopolystoma xenopodis]|uniref:Uncharacterized protein n=1 Tax=Protopolystoma xenopodis TaxID=117903 RepID=A0A448XMG6_9PLAT|nr:unnamed protein product [Protopolystoma xenopodis]
MTDCTDKSWLGTSYTGVPMMDSSISKEVNVLPSDLPVKPVGRKRIGQEESAVADVMTRSSLQYPNMLGAFRSNESIHAQLEPGYSSPITEVNLESIVFLIWSHHYM